jgi:hypothetical protein
MTVALEFICPVVDGRISDTHTKRIGEAIRAFDGRRVSLAIKEVKPTRSNNQNRYMWGVVVRMITVAFREAGNMVDDQEVYEFLKAHVWKLNQFIVSPDGEVFKSPGSTRKLTKQEMELRLEEARAWAAEVLGIQIPLPNEESELTN